MFARSLKSFFLGRKKKPIVNAGKITKARKRVVLGLELLEDRVTPASFTAGDLAILQAAASASNTTASIIDLNPTAANQTATAANTFAIPGGASNANGLQFSGSATSTGYLSHTNDGSLITFLGANSTNTTANVNTLNPRGVGAFNAAGVYTLQTTYTGVSGNQTRSATSLDNSTWYIGDQGGFYTNNATTPSPTGNFRSVKSFGGTVYAFTASASAPPVGTISAATGGTYTGLPGLANGTANAQDFYLIQSGSNGSTYDVLYVLSASSATAGTIQKFSLVGGSWNANGSFTTTFGGFGIAAAKSGSGAALYVSTGLGATTDNSVIELADTAGYNTAINITAANDVTLYTATGNAIVKGVDFAPVTGATATTTTITSISPLTQTTGNPVTFTATVSANSGSTAPTAGTVSFFDGGTGGALLATATSETTSSTTDTFTVTSSSVPGGTFSNITAVYTAGAGFSNSTSAVFGSTLQMNGPIAPAGFTNLNNTEFTAGASGSFQFTLSNTPNPAAAYTVVSGSLPTGVTLNSSTGLLSGMPNAVAQPTPDTFTVQASNTGGSITQSFTLYVVPAVTTPVPFTPGDILIYRVGDGGVTYGSEGTGGVSGGAAAAVFLDEYTPSGVFVQSIAVPTTSSGGNLATVDSISASSDGMLSLSADGHSVVFTGYNASVGTANIAGSTSASDPRVIGTVNAAGVVATATDTNGDFSGSNIRSAATVDGREFYVSGNSPSGTPGVQYINTPGTPNSASTGVTETSNTNAVAVIDGQLYFSTRSTTGNAGTGVYAAGSPLPTSAPSGPTDSDLIGASPSPDQFAIVDMDNSGTLTAGDRLYYVDDTNTTGIGGLYRADFNGSSWSTPVLVASGDIRLEGLTGVRTSSTTATLFATDSQTNFGATTQFNTHLLKLTDSNSTPTTGLVWTTLVTLQDPGSTAAAVEQFRGVAIVPQAAGTTVDAVAVAPNGQTLISGSPVTFTATVPSAATGYISFVVNSQTLATVQVVNGQASFTASSLPAGSVTVTAFYSGDGTFEANSGSSTNTFQGGVAPTITSPPTMSVTTGQTGHYQVSAAGSPASFTYSLSGAPSWVSINSTTGLLTFTAPAGFSTNTPFNFTVTASNGVTPAATQNFTLTVTNGSFTPGDIVLLQVGDGTTQYSTEAPVFLVEYTPGGQLVQTVAVPNTEVVGGSGNQPLTLDIGSTADKNGNGTGQLSRSFDSSVLTFGGNDAGVNGGSFGSDSRVIAQVGIDPFAAGGINTTTYGSFNSDDDIRAIAELNSTTLYDGGKATPATNGGLRYFNGLTTGGGTTGTEVSGSATGNNVRGVTVAFNGQVFYTSASNAGVYESTSGGSPVFDPTAAGTDTQIIADPSGSAQKLNGLFVADMNGDGVLDSGDKIYFVDPTDGLYSSTFNGTTWSAAVNLGGGAGTGLTYVGLTGQVVSSSEVELYYTASDGKGNTSLFNFDDNGTNTTQTALLQDSSASDKGLSLTGVAFAPLSATTLTTSASSHSIIPGGSETFTATVSSPNSVGAINSGRIYFIDTVGGVSTVLNPGGSAITNGTATFTMNSLAVGQHNVHAYYAGNATIAAATSASQVVAVTGATASSVMITSATPNPSTVGATVHFTATVTTNATGTVEFFDNGTSLGTAQITTSGGVSTATLAVSLLSQGTHPNITASYDGDATFMGSTSAAVSETINAGAAITVSAPNNGATAPGAIITFTATVVGNGLSGLPNGSPTGTVQFFEDGGATPFATGTLSGSGNTLTATGNSAALTAGSHLITATYVPGGGSQYASVATQSPPWIETAQQAFTPGDVVVLRRPNNNSNAAQLVYLDEYSTSGNLVQTIILPDADNAATDTHIVALSGKASTEGALVRSGDGDFLSVFGFDLAIGTSAATSTSPNTTPRSVADINQAGTIDTSTALTTSSANDSALSNVRGAVTLNGQQFWVVGSDSSGSTPDSGIQFAADGKVGTPTAVGPNNVEGNAAEILGGQLYVSTPSGDVIDQVGTGLPTGAAALTPLPGLAAAYASAISSSALFLPPGGVAGANPYSFLLFNHLDGSSINPDTLYIADQTYGLLKFALVSGQWTFESQKLNNNNGIEGLSGYEVNPGTSGYSFVLFATAAISTGNPGNQLLSFTDTNAFNAPNAGGTFTVLGTAANPTDSYSGLALAPGYVTDATLAETGSSAAGYTITATVSSPSASSNVPTGVVYFYLDGGTTPIGTGVLNSHGVATLTVAAGVIGSGSHTVTAAYQGDLKDGTSTGVLTWNDPPFAAGDLIATLVGTGAGALTSSGTATFVNEYTTAANQTNPVQSIALPSTGSDAVTEGGTATIEGFITDSSDGHSAVFAGYNTAAGSSTTGANAVVAVVNPNGSIDTSTQIPNADTTIGTSSSVKAVASADGLGFYVATNDYIQYVPVGNSPLTPTTAVSNFFTANDGTSGGHQSTQSPNDAVIGAGQLYGDAGSQAQTDGVPAADGPFTIGTGLPTSAGQSAAVFSGFPTVADGTTANQFPMSEQFSISPDGGTIIVADARTDGNGVVFMYEDYNITGQWSAVASFKFATTGLTGLSVDWTNPAAPVIYAVTTTTNAGNAQNSIVSFAATDPGIADDANEGSINSPTTLATAPANEAFRGVALAPKAAGVTASITTLTANAGIYPTGSLSATVTGGSGTPTGWVSFQNNGIEIGSAQLNSSGVATLVPASNFFAGSYTDLVAVYTGNSTYAASTSTPAQSLTISKGTPDVTITPSTTFVGANVPVALTATVNVPVGTAATPTTATDGTVTFWNGPVGTGVNLGSAPVTSVISGGTQSFQASLSYSFANLGTYTITAVYSGNQNFVGKTSDSTEAVNVVPTSSTVITTSNANPTASPSQNVTLTATVTGSGNNTAGEPNGTVQFFDNGLAITSAITTSTDANHDLVASVTLPTALLEAANTLLPGQQTITAVYSGGSNYFGSTGVLDQAVQAKSIASGDSLVYRVGDGSVALASNTGAIVYVDEYSPTGTLVQSIVMPTFATAMVGGVATGTPVTGLVSSGLSTSEGELSESTNGQVVLLTGYDAANGATGLPSSTDATVPRVVAEINLATGAIDLSTVISSGFASGGNPRGATSADGVNIYLSGSVGGVGFTTLGSTSATEVSSTQGNTRQVYIFPAIGGTSPQLYVTADPSTNAFKIGTVGTGLPTTAGAVVTALPGIPTMSGVAPTGGDPASPYGFFFAHLNGTADVGPDTLYIAQDGNNFVGGSVEKFSLVSGTWVENGSVAADNIRGLSGAVNADGSVTLYATGTSATSGDLITFTDSSGYNGTLTATPTVLVQTASTNEGFRGVVDVQSATTTMLVDNGPNPSTIGSTLPSFTVTVTGGSSITGETVNIEDASNGNAIVATPTLSTGTDTFTISGLSAGTHNLFAVFGGDGGHTGSQSAQVSQVVNNALINTSTTLVDNGPNPSFLGQAVSFTATVTPASGPAINGETVTIKDASTGNTVATPTLSNNTVTFNVSNLTIGSHLLFAVYTADATRNGSQSANISPAQTVTAVGTTTVVTSDNANPTGASGATVDFTATVTAQDGTHPAGTVQFFDNGLALGSAEAVNGSGVATFTETTSLLQATNKLTPGIHSITAIFTPTPTTYLGSTGVADQTVTANPFGAGDVFVYRTGDGSTTNFASGKANAVFIDEFNSAGTLEQSIAFPGTTVGSVNALTQNANQGAGAFLNLSADGQELLLEGYAASVGSTSLTTQVVAEVSANGTINTTTTDSASVGVIRSVASASGTTLYYGTSTGGVQDETLGGTTSTQISGSPVTNTRIVEIAGGQLYVSSASGTAIRVATVGTGLPTTGGQTETELSGVTSAQLGSGPYSYYFTNLNGGTGFDTLYVAANDSAIGIVKYALESGTWTEVGEIPSTAATEFAGLTGITTGTPGNETVTPYATNNLQFAATTGGNLVSIVDATGYEGNISSLTPTVLATAGANTNFHGVAIVPVAATASTTTTVTSTPASPIAQGASITFTATITGNPNVGTVTFFAGPGLTNQIGSPVNVVNGLATSAATTTLPVGTDTITAVYSGGTGFAGSQGTENVVVNGPPPSITGVVIDQDIPALFNAAGQPSAGKQRSMVDDVVYTFSAPVNITSASVEANVFTIAVASGFTGTVPTLSWAPVAGTNNTEWAVSFSGNGVSGNSIANGAYTITVNDPTAITAISDGQAVSLGSSGTVGGATQSFFRLYGDINGDEVVGTLDNARFKTALTTYNAAFDVNNDGVVGTLDNARFKTDLALNFTGFTPTI